MTQNTSRKNLALLWGTLLSLAVAIVLLPYQFLFFKIVPVYFFSNWLPSPFTAGWLITLLLLIPAAWLSKTAAQARQVTLRSTIGAVLLGTPLSLYFHTEAFTVNNLIQQLLWVSVITLPPMLAHLLARSASEMCQTTRRNKH